MAGVRNGYVPDSDAYYIKTGEAAQLLGKSARTVARLCEQKKIPHRVTEGGHYMIRRRVIRALVLGLDPWKADKGEINVPIPA